MASFEKQIPAHLTTFTSEWYREAKVAQQS